MEKTRGKKKLDGHLKEVGMKWEEVKTINKMGIKKKIRKEDTRKWKEELESKSSLNLYKKFKKEIKEERIYDNK